MASGVPLQQSRLLVLGALVLIAFVYQHCTIGVNANNMEPLLDDPQATDFEGANSADVDGVDENSDEDDIEIESFVYREPGCPIVAERVNFDLEQFHGIWKIPYGSMNWLTDMTKALLRRDPKVSEIKNLCPEVEVRSLVNTTKANATDDKATMEIDWKCSKKKVEFSIRCWPQRQWTQSKFECYFPTINVHSFVMVAATDHISWILLVRCKVGTANEPGEGMSWLLLAKNETVDNGTMSVIFGLLEGYGFDVESFKFQYQYDKCGMGAGNGDFDLDAMAAAAASASL